MTITLASAGTGVAPCPCGRDAHLRHVNTRNPSDPRADRAVCRHCGKNLEREPGHEQWTGSAASSAASASPNAAAASSHSCSSALVR